MRLLSGLALGALVASSAFAQYVISAHSGVVQYVQGRALLNDKEVDLKVGQYPDIKENQVFRTEEGLAEVLLTPGVFLRMPENSSIRMVSNKLTDTRVEVLMGSAMVELDNVEKDNAIMLLYKGNSILLVKRGLYRVDTNPARFQVYDGEAIVKGDAAQLTLKSGKETSLEAVLMAQSFDKKAEDDLYRWSSHRSEYLSKASVSSAMGLGSGYTSTGSYGWRWNPLFGLYTFIPGSGVLYSPFGWGFFSPYAAYNYFYPGYYYGGGGGGISNTRPSFTPYSAGQLGYSSVGRAASAGAMSAPTSTGAIGGGAVGGGSVGGGAAAGGGRTGGASTGGGGGRGR